MPTPNPPQGQADLDRPLSAGRAGRGRSRRPLAGRQQAGPRLRAVLAVAAHARNAGGGAGHDRLRRPAHRAGASTTPRPGTLIALADTHPRQSERLMLVGHNPGFEQLAALLHSGQSGDYRGMPPGGIAVLTRARRCQPGTRRGPAQRLLVAVTAVPATGRAVDAVRCWPDASLRAGVRRRRRRPLAIRRTPASTLRLRTRWGQRVLGDVPRYDGEVRRAARRPPPGAHRAGGRHRWWSAIPSATPAWRAETASSMRPVIPVVEFVSEPHDGRAGHPGRAPARAPDHARRQPRRVLHRGACAVRPARHATATSSPSGSVRRTDYGLDGWQLGADRPGALHAARAR